MSAQNRHRGEVLASHTEVSASYSGPIPSASQLARYEQIYPGAASKIFTMAEEQAAHRRRLETIVLTTNAKNSTLGVISAFVLGVLTIVGGVFLAYFGRELSGAILGSAGLVGLAGVFIYGTRSSRTERANKR